MGELFEVAELVRVAVEDEKTGVAFYSALAEKTRSPELRETFSQLAEEERGHQKRFEEMLKSMGAHKAPERYAGEYVSYLNALTSDRAFPDESAAVEMAGKCGGDLPALELAIRVERDTLILMQEMRRLLPERHRAVVDELADEERSHVVKLSAARERLKG